MANDDIPTYNLKAVVQETGLKPDTLRAWERRYGVPDPERTGGGHRLYSQQDINTLKWLLARQEEGMSISRAVGLWQSLKAEGRDPLQVYPLHPPQETSPTYTMAELGDTVIELRRHWIDACLAFDERRAELILNQAFSYYSPEVVCFELVQKALLEIGNGWYEGIVTVQQEHFASALAMRRLDSLLAATPAPTRTGRIIVGCSPGDNHTFSPLLITFLLRRRGWDIVYLGADVPTNRLRATIERTRPELVVFSAQLLDTAAALLDVAHYLQGIGVPLAFGGYVFGLLPQLVERIPGHFLGNELGKAPQVIEHLVINRPPMPQGLATPEVHRAAAGYFRERVGLIDTHVWQALSEHSVDPTAVADANRYLARNILSALKLGDLSFIGANLTWLEGMMVNYNLPPDGLKAFLRAYREAAGQYLTEPQGRPVIDWLDDVVTTCETAGAELAHYVPAAS